MSVLVDTDMIIDALNGIDRVLNELDRLATQGVAISVVTLAEVLDGSHRSPDPAGAAANAREFLRGYGILPVTDQVAEVFAERRAGLRRAGNLIPDLDLLIASTAIVHDLTLFTRNQRHFARVPGLRLYDDGQRSFGTTPVS